MPIPFTYEQAADIAEDFGDLEDTGLVIELDDNTIACHIQKIAVAPYAEADKEIFIAAYKANSNAEKAIENYTGVEYTVLILALSSESSELIVLPIQKYTIAYGVNYRYP